MEHADAFRQGDRDENCYYNPCRASCCSERSGQTLESRQVRGELVSASIETYLLARSRVTHVPALERNYHVFYLLFHLHSEEQEMLGLTGLEPKDFKSPHPPPNLQNLFALL